MRRASILLLVMLLIGVAACTVESGGTSTDTESPHIDDGPVDLIHDRGAAAAAIAALEEAIGASPAQLRDATIYAEYFIVEAQDPSVPEHIDRYEWRDDDVDGPEPVQLTGPQEDVDASLYPSSAVQWERIPTLARKAEEAAEHAEPIRIEEPRATYVNVERSTSSEDDGRIIVRFSISGPRRSGYVETTASGEIREVVVS
jgi:hypothetical protein